MIQVDVRGEHFGRRVRVDVPLAGTDRDTIGALLPLLRTSRDAYLLCSLAVDGGQYIVSALLPEAIFTR